MIIKPDKGDIKAGETCFIKVILELQNQSLGTIESAIEILCSNQNPSALPFRAQVVLNETLDKKPVVKKQRSPLAPMVSVPSKSRVELPQMNYASFQKARRQQVSSVK
jgi:hypothetical protein